MKEFKKGDVVYRKCPVVSSVEGTVGRTTEKGIVAGDPVEWGNETLLPVVWEHTGKCPFLTPIKEIKEG